MNINNQIIEDLVIYSDEDFFDYYKTQLPSLVQTTIDKVRRYLQDAVNTPQGLLDYFHSCGREKSMELIINWDVDVTDPDNQDLLYMLHEMMGDNLPRMIAYGMTGEGRGLREIFDEFPDLLCMV